MGLLDNLTHLLSGRGKSPAPVTLEDGEEEISRVAACTVKGGGRPWVGGDLVLTNRRVLFAPLDVTDAAALLSYGLKKAGAPSDAIALVGWIASQVRPETLERSEVLAASAGRSAGVLNPPTLTVHRADGTNLEFGILASRMSPNLAKANESVRDEYLAVLASTA